VGEVRSLVKRKGYKRLIINAEWAMARRSITLKSQVFPADRDDMYKGWIRLSDDLRNGIQSGTYVQLIANRRKVCCLIRGTPGKAGRIEMNEWYRNTLGWSDPPNEAELTIKEVGTFRRIGAWSRHPDDIVRVGIGVGMISVGLGLLSIVSVSFLPATRLMVSTHFIGGLACVVIEAILTLVVLYLLGTGLWTLLRKPPKPIDRKDSS